MSLDRESPLPVEKLVVLTLALATLTVFWQVRDCQFVNYDDPRYVTRNPQVQEGLTRASAWWALTTLYNTNWHPLTWLSLQLDYQIYQLNPWGFHVTNLLLHTANALLLFWVLRRMTKAIWPSALVAALFALHPLHVQSVAWISERKDVLSTFFWMATLWAYVRWTESPGFVRYVMVLVALALGLMAKPMLVTLPFVLLLLDYWPLGRLPPAGQPDGRTELIPFYDATWLRRLVEKAPHFALCAASCFITFYAQQHGGSVRTLEDLPLSGRLINAVLAYAGYIGKMFWPRDLAIFYPRSELPWSDASVLGSCLLLVVVTALAVWQRRRRPYLVVGWFWYLGTLVPVIGLVQVGDQAMADRYTYVPLIGLFIAAAWTAAELAQQGRQLAVAVSTVMILVLLGCSALTWVQVTYWHDSVALWQRAIQVTNQSAAGHYGLGIAFRDEARLLEDNGKRQEAKEKLGLAVREFTRSKEITPDDPRTRYELGCVLLFLGKHHEAENELAETLRLAPADAEAHFQLGILCSIQGKSAESVSHYEEALRLRPNFPAAHMKLAFNLIQRQKFDEAGQHLMEAKRLDPRLKNNRVFQELERTAALGAMP